MFSPSRYLSKTCFRRTRFQIVVGQPLTVQPNSLQIRVPYLSKPPGNAISVKPRYIGSLATIVVRGNRPRIRVPHIEVPLTPSKITTISVLPAMFF